MKAQLGRHSDTIYALLRIVAGFLFACHGAQKIFGLFGGAPPEAPAFVVWAAGSIELVGGLLIMIGLLTSWAAFLSSGTMAVSGASAFVSGRMSINSATSSGANSSVSMWCHVLSATKTVV